VKTLFPQKHSEECFTDPKSTVELQLLNFLLLTSMLKDEEDSVMIVEPGRVKAGIA
jgi:hypothetical protein